MKSNLCDSATAPAASNKSSSSSQIAMPSTEHADNQAAATTGRSSIGNPLLMPNLSAATAFSARGGSLDNDEGGVGERGGGGRAHEEQVQVFEAGDDSGGAAVGRRGDEGPAADGADDSEDVLPPLLDPLDQQHRQPSSASRVNSQSPQQRLQQQQQQQDQNNNRSTTSSNSTNNVVHFTKGVYCGSDSDRELAVRATVAMSSRSTSTIHRDDEHHQNDDKQQQQQQQPGAAASGVGGVESQGPAPKPGLRFKTGSNVGDDDEDGEQQYNPPSGSRSLPSTLHNNNNEDVLMEAVTGAQFDVDLPPPDLHEEPTDEGDDGLCGLGTVKRKLSRRCRRFRRWFCHFIAFPPMYRTDEEITELMCVPSTLFIFSGTNPIRKVCLRLMQYNVFKLFIMISVIYSCVVLAIDEPAVPQSSDFVKFLDTSDIVLTAIFAFEMMVKIIALGFVLHPGAYLRNPWNIVDFIVVISSVVSSSVGESDGSSGLKAFRVLRPLRSFSRIKKIQHIMDALIAGMPAVFNNLVLFLLLLFMFSIVFLQQWQTSLSKRCYAAAPSNANQTAEFFYNSTTATIVPFMNTFAANWSFPLLVEDGGDAVELCGGTFVCPATTTAINPMNALERLLLPVKCAVNSELYGRKSLHFDNLFASLLLTFKIMTLDNWPDDSYNFMNAEGAPVTIVLLVIVVLVGNFWCVNLFLAIVTSGYTNTDDEEAEEAAAAAKRRDQALMALSAVPPTRMGGESRAQTNTVMRAITASPSSTVEAFDSIDKFGCMVQSRRVRGFIADASQQCDMDREASFLSRIDVLEEAVCEVLGIGRAGGAAAGGGPSPLVMGGRRRSSLVRVVTDGSHEGGDDVQRRPVGSRGRANGLPSGLEEDMVVMQDATSADDGAGGGGHQLLSIPAITAVQSTFFSSGEEDDPQQQQHLRGQMHVQPQQRGGLMTVKSDHRLGAQRGHRRSILRLTASPISGEAAAAMDGAPTDTATTVSRRDSQNAITLVSDDILKSASPISPAIRRVSLRVGSGTLANHIAVRDSSSSSSHHLQPPQQTGNHDQQQRQEQGERHHDHDGSSQQQPPDAITKRPSDVIEMDVEDPDYEDYTVIFTEDVAQEIIDEYRRVAEERAFMEEFQMARQLAASSPTAQKRGGGDAFNSDDEGAQEPTGNDDDDQNYNYYSSFSNTLSMRKALEEEEDLDTSDDSDADSDDDDDDDDNGDGDDNGDFFERTPSDLDGARSPTEGTTSFASTQAMRARRLRKKRRQLRQKREGQRHWIRKAVGHFLHHPICVLFMLLVTVLAVVVLAIDHYRIEKGLSDALNGIGITCTALFALELLLKFFAFGIIPTLRQRLNLFDCLLVLLSIPDIITSDGDQSSLSALRVFRLFRVFRLLRSVRSLHAITQAIAQSIAGATYVTLMLFVVLFVYATLGMKLFGSSYPGKIPPKDADKDSFGTFPDALMTCFIVITGEDWTAKMSAAMQDSSGPLGSLIAVAFFISLFMLGNFIFINLFVAIIVDKLSSRYEELVATSDGGNVLVIPNDTDVKKAKDKTVANALHPPTLILPEIRRKTQVSQRQHPVGSPLGGEGSNTFGTTGGGASFSSQHQPLSRHSPHNHTTSSSANHLKKFLNDAEKEHNSCSSRLHRALTFLLYTHVEPVGTEKSLFIFAGDNPIRYLCRVIAGSRLYSFFTVFVLVGNVVILAFEGPNTVLTEDIINIADISFTAVFVIELLLHIIAYGLLFPVGEAALSEYRGPTSREEDADDGEEEGDNKNGTATTQKLRGAPPTTEATAAAAAAAKLSEREHSDAVVPIGGAGGNPAVGSGGEENQDLGNTLSNKMDNNGIATASHSQSHSILVVNSGQYSPLVSPSNSHPPATAAEDANQHRAKPTFAAAPTTDLLPIDGLQQATSINSFGAGSSHGSVSHHHPRGGAGRGGKGGGGDSQDDDGSSAIRPILCSPSGQKYTYHVHPAYLRNGWNVLLAIVTISALIENAVPLFKLFRPIRTVYLMSKIESTRIVVVAVVKAIPNVLSGIVVIVFIFVIFGVIGVDFFKGKYYQCSDPSITRRVDCVGLFNKTDTIGVNSITAEEIRVMKRLPLHFDHFGASLLSLFVYLIGDEWSHIMFTGMYTTSEGNGISSGTREASWAGAFFVIAYVALNFFSANFLSGILINYFSKMKKLNDGSVLLTLQQRLFMKARRAIEEASFERTELLPMENPVSLALDYVLNYSITWTSFSDVGAAIQRRLFCFKKTDHHHHNTKQSEIINGTVAAATCADGAGAMISRSTDQESSSEDIVVRLNKKNRRGVGTTGNDLSNTASGVHVNDDDDDDEGGEVDPRGKYFFNRSPIFDFVILIIVFVNVGFVSSISVGMTPEHTSMVDTVNLVCLILYTIEAAMRLVAYFPAQYFSVGWNLFDFVIVAAGWLDVILTDFPALAFLRVLRLLRALRGTGVEKLITTLLLSFTTLFNVLLVLSLVLFVFAVAGVILFSRLKDLQAPMGRNFSFKTVPEAMWLLFNIATKESWAQFMVECMAKPDCTGSGWEECGNSEIAVVYFTSFMTIGSFIALQLFVAAIVDVYDDDNDEDEEESTEEQKRLMAAISDNTGVSEACSLFTENTEDIISAFRGLKAVWSERFGAINKSVDFVDFIAILPYLPMSLTADLVTISCVAVEEAKEAVQKPLIPSHLRRHLAGGGGGGDDEDNDDDGGANLSLTTSTSIFKQEGKDSKGSIHAAGASASAGGGSRHLTNAPPHKEGHSSSSNGNSSRPVKQVQRMSTHDDEHDVHDEKGSDITAAHLKKNSNGNSKNGDDDGDCLPHQIRSQNVSFAAAPASASAPAATVGAGPPHCSASGVVAPVQQHPPPGGRSGAATNSSTNARRSISGISAPRAGTATPGASANPASGAHHKKNWVPTDRATIITAAVPIPSRANGRFIRFLTSLHLPIDSEMRVAYRDVVYALAYRKFTIDVRTYSDLLHTSVFTLEAFTAAEAYAAMLLQRRWRKFALSAVYKRRLADRRRSSAHLLLRPGLAHPADALANDEANEDIDVKSTVDDVVPVAPGPSVAAPGPPPPPVVPVVGDASSAAFLPAHTAEFSTE